MSDAARFPATLPAFPIPIPTPGPQPVAWYLYALAAGVAARAALIYLAG